MKLRLWPANEKSLRKMAKESKVLSMDKIGNWIIANFLIGMERAEKEAEAEVSKNRKSMIEQTNKDNLGIFEAIPGYQHYDGMWFGEDKHITYRPLAESIIDRFQPKSVLELGCGAGSLAWHMRDLYSKCKVVTIDGNPDTSRSPWVNPDFHFIARTDIPVSLQEDGVPMKFDMILSFEHFEHIQAEQFGVFFKNMKDHAESGAILFATAATWSYGAGNNVHCNVKSGQQWRQELTFMGMSDTGISLLTESNRPFNFLLKNTSELIFKF